MTWLLSYVVVLFVPILFSAAVYWQTKHTIENQIERGNDSLIRQMQEVVDNEIEAAKRLTMQIYGNVRVQDLFYSNKFYRDDYRYELYNIIKDLRDYKTSYSMFFQFYIFWAAGDLVIMPNLYRAAESAYEDLYTGGALSLEDWRKAVRSSSPRQYMLTSLQTTGSEKRSFVNLMSSFPVDSNNQPVGTIVTMMDTKQLSKAIDNVSHFNGGEVLVLNEQKQVLVSNGSIDGGTFNFDSLKGEHGSFNDKYKGDWSLFTYSKSKSSGLIYLTVSPSRLVWKEAQYVRNLTYSSIAFSVIGGIVLTLLFLRRNYKPLGKLLQSMALKAGVSIDKGSNEFLFIQNALSKTFDEKDQIKLRMKQQQNQLRSNFLSRMLKGRLENQIPTQEALSAFDLQFKTDDFCVVLFYLEDNYKFFERMKDMTVPDRFKLLQFIVTNVVEELVADQLHNGYVAEIDDMMACLINLRADQSHVNDQIYQIAEEAQRFLKSKFEIDVTVSISAVHRSLAKVTDGYKEAMDAMEYKLVMGKKGIIVYDQLQIDSLADLKDGYYYPLQVEQQLINYVKVGDVEKARLTLNDIMERNFKRNILSVELTKCLLFDLISTFVKTIQEIGDIQETFLASNPRAIEKLTASETVSDMHRQLTEVLEEVCQYTFAKHCSNKNKHRQDELQQFTQMIIHYIMNNYQDTNLNISLLGEQFSMKATYLSKLFKDQTGESLPDAINKIRIEKAKQLLKQERAPLQDIANRCGFSDMNTFMRTFKKWEGITPGKYKVLE
jgi:YesN/AraC family two-component response regulator